MPTRDTSVKVTLGSEADAAAVAAVQTIGGYGSGQYAPDPDYAYIVEEGNERVINIPLTSEMWGRPYFETYYMQVLVILMDEEGTPLETTDGDYMMGIASYTCDDSAEARLELTFPNQQNIDNEMYSIAQAYEMGTCSAIFSKKIVASASGGTISIYNYDGKELASSELIFIDEEWSDMDGLYQVNYTYDPEEGISAEDIARMEIQLEGVEYDYNTEMNISTITLFPKQKTRSAPRKKL